MSKLYIPALALALVGGSASAQQAQTGHATNKAGLSKTPTAADSFYSVRRPAAPVLQTADRAAFWSEDFSGGAIPSGWTNVDDQTPLTETQALFSWSDDPAAVTVAAAGQPDVLTFLAPGATNGYLWCNSDRGLPSAPAINHLSRLTTTAIDCSGQPSVMLTMQSTIGVFDNDANQFVKVRVSTDLSTWTEFVPFPCLVTGAVNPPCERFSANPTAVLLNITSAAANQPVVYIQFQWEGGWEYWWGIDDLELSPLLDNEIAMNYAYNSTTGLGEEYGRIPLAQMPLTMNIGAEIFNFGASEQTNVVVNCDVTGPSAFSTDIPLLDPNADGTIPSNDTALADMDYTLPSPIGIGVYNASYTVSSDQSAMDADPSDNMRLRNFEVTDNLYSLDAIGNYPEGTESLTQVGSASFTDNPEGVKLLTMYYVNAPMSVTGFQIALGPASDPGSSIKISFVDTADALSTPSVVNNFVNGIESDAYTLTQADVDAGVVNLAFPTPVALGVGAYYAVATLTGDGTGDLDVFVMDDGTVPQPALASALWIPFDIQDDGSEGPHFYGGNGTAWAVRVSTNPNISVAENPELQGVTMYPNPTNGILRINTTQNEKYTVEVMNVLGKLMMTTKFTGMTVLDLEKFADGVYTVRVSNGSKSTVQRITLN